MVNRAVFFDRDGTLIEEMLNSKTGKYESVKTPDQVKFCKDAITTLKSLQAQGYFLFLVSNQPDYAKRKNTMENIQAVHYVFEQKLKENGVKFKRFDYCYHHPEGVVKSHSYKCSCRKPEPFSLFNAARDYDIDMSKSWMVGDRDTDVECGKRAGVKTIKIDEKTTLFKALKTIFEDEP
jgi:D-glycero-D-manno-heptose 1,7-bisphosphate phosphatase